MTGPNELSELRVSDLVLTGRVLCGSVKVKGPRRSLVRRRGHA